MHSPVPKVALVYDWLDTAYGGAEKVVAALHTAFPDAPIFTSVSTKKAVSWTAGMEIKPSFLQSWPLLSAKPRYLLPFLPLAFESLKLDAYDVVISITSGQAKGVLTKPHQLHICYLLTPPRYLYSHRAEYLARVPSFLRLIVQPILSYLTWWDSIAATRPDIYIPISKVVQKRCLELYHQQTAPVIYPPVEKLQQTAVELPALPKHFHLVISRLVGYKRIDLAIQAALALGHSLVIIGDGEERAHLEQLAGSSPLIQFLGHQPQAVVNGVLHAADSLLMPGIEDFGISAAEAVAVGKPVVVHQESGVAELLTNKTGVLLQSLEVEEMKRAMKKVKTLQTNSVQLTQSMRKYATTRFVRSMQEIVSKQQLRKVI